MITVYNDADLLSAYKQKNKVLCIFWAVTAVYVLTCLAMLIYHISLPYASALDVYPQMVTYVLSALYVVFVFPFMCIKYSRVNSYVTMLSFISSGIKVVETEYFYIFRPQTLQKEKIDVTSCVFATWNKKKEEWYEREIYADQEKPQPDFGGGDLVRYVTQSNILLQYEILQRHAYDFYEEEDETEEQETIETIETKEGEIQ